MNPDDKTRYDKSWTEDEYIITLDLYFETSPSERSAKNKKIRKCAELIKRTSASVVYRLGNYSAVDLSSTLHGFDNGGKTVKQMFDKYASNRSRLKQLANIAKEQFLREHLYDSWSSAVLSALKRYADRHGSRKIRRQDLIHEELQQIIIDTASNGKTPEQTLSRYLQKLRDVELISFLDDDGTYLLLDEPIEIEKEDLSDGEIDLAIKKRKLHFGKVETSDVVVQSRQRKGQARLRALTLQNYGRQCALCDVKDERLLVASHVVRWADDSDVRGDLSNLICFCKFHDALFEAGYLSLDDNMKILCKDSDASSTISLNLKAAHSFRNALEVQPNIVYLRRHRERSGIDDFGRKVGGS